MSLFGPMLPSCCRGVGSTTLARRPLIWPPFPGPPSQQARWNDGRWLRSACCYFIGRERGAGLLHGQSRADDAPLKMRVRVDLNKKRMVGRKPNQGPRASMSTMAPTISGVQKACKAASVRYWPEALPVRSTSEFSAHTALAAAFSSPPPRQAPRAATSDASTSERSLIPNLKSKSNKAVIQFDLFCFFDPCNCGKICWRAANTAEMGPRMPSDAHLSKPPARDVPQRVRAKNTWPKCSKSGSPRSS